MKILYELVITEETGFTASDFPDRFEILRKDKTPLVFKPCALNVQEMYNRLNEAEALLIQAKGLNEIFTYKGHPQNEGDEIHFELESDINEYFDRYLQ